jgi:polar amino acid transport system substrate-binding protein
MRIFSALFLILLLNANSSFGCELVIRFVQYPPLSYLDEHDQWQGMDIEIVTELLKRVNCGYKLTSLIWVRAIDSLEKGKIDLMSNISKLPSREPFAYFIGPTRNEQIVLASLKSQPVTVKNLREFNTHGKPIAIQRGADYGDTFADILAKTPNPKEHYLTIPSNSMKLSLMLRSRISGFIEEKVNIVHKLKTNPSFNKLSLHFEPLHSNPVYFALSKNSITPALFTKMKKAFATMQQDGTLERIQAKY